MYKSAAPPRQNASILGVLKATEMLDNRPVLPAEILVAILDYLPVSDLMRAARASSRLREMVYDDTRWVSRLKSMGCWDEADARRRFEDALRRRREAAERANAARGAVPGKPADNTLFDAVVEEDRRQKAAAAMSALADGFETTTLSPAKDTLQDSGAILDVFKNVKSVRGFARQEYGKIYGALAPFYFDLIHAKSHTDPIIFKVFPDPERQARMLSNLRVFAASDWAQGWSRREEKLMTLIGVFESAVLREFEQGYEFWDIDGRMKRYATVLHFLNGATAGVNLFIDKHPIFNDVQMSSNPAECLDQATSDGITLEPARVFLEALAKKVNEQSAIIARIFPEPGPVFWTFVDKVREDVIMEYCTPLFDEAHERNILAYLKAVSGMSEHCLWFFQSLAPPSGTGEDLEAKAKELTLKTFEPHLDLYFQEELDYFTREIESEVAGWEKKLSEQDASVESFYMSNFNRQADKKDFLSSFKKVVMMPVTVLPAFPIGSPFATSKPAQPTNANESSDSLAVAPVKPSPFGSTDGRKSPLPEKAPDDELAAKAALMTSRLEGIKGLFSLEVALDLVHAAKASLGRTSVFIGLGGHSGEEAKEQCATTFVVLLRILGSRHIKAGFDKAVDHLSNYNPRAVSDHSEAGVAPLVTFIELVNVGDLISQMVDVFYEQQLAATKIADKNDFLDPAGLAKKKFEQMLDESVAAGLNKGIDVLMDEVEYIQGSTQQPTDYNPSATSTAEGGVGAMSASDLDIGPTSTAKRIVDLVSSHTKMLVGTTEKSMLDVFNGEVGLRLFTALCKHLKRQRVSTAGAIKVISDANLYFDYIRTLRNQDLLAYFGALRELSQIYLIDAGHAKEMAAVIADGDRFGGIFRAEEVYEFAQRRADWYQVRKDVERAMYGMECLVM
ncbi:related to Sls2 protein [Cephalotrichum gorgonifer]|uniref:Related to Sls2 protein n=1 Tax=Cephalotrichum gorgonifer TaxID=2041049 RepID=A0AAE8STL2_9PEZI|nr:related to Sls2 protein [Cephalotrichum gorgonifer]